MKRKNFENRIDNQGKLNSWWWSIKLEFYRLSVSKDLKDRLEIPRIILYGLIWGFFNPLIISYLFIYLPTVYLTSTTDGLALFGAVIWTGDPLEFTPDINPGYQIMRPDIGVMMYCVCSAISIMLLALNSPRLIDLDCDWLNYIVYKGKLIGFLIFTPPYWIFFAGYLFSLSGFVFFDLIATWGQSQQFLLIYVTLIALSIFPFWLFGMHIYILICILSGDYSD